MDPSWCPGCDRLILPKRILVPITPSVSDNHPSQLQSPPLPPPPPTSTPVPSSPQVRKKHTQRPRRLDLGGRLLHGTGLVRPGAPPPQPKSSSNSGNSSTKEKPTRRTQQQSQKQQQQQQQSRKSRVVISQDPTPLYCSEECRVRDLKNSFIESESAGFAGAPAALQHIAKLEHIQQLEKRFQNQKKLTRRHSSNASPTLSSQASTDNTTGTAPSSTSPSTSTNGVASTSSSDPSTSTSPPPPSPSSPTDSKSKVKPLFRTSSYSSTSTTSSNTKDRTIRPTPRRNSSTSVLLSRVPSWGSPTKAALAPPTTNLFHACSSSCSLDSITGTSSVSMSSLFEGSYTRQSVDTEGTTPSRSGSGSSGSDEKRKGKRVSFAGDSKPSLVESPVVEEEDDEKIASTSTSATQIATRDEVSKLDTTTTTAADADADVTEDWRLLSKNRRRNPLQDAHPLLEALSLSPKDRRARPSSLPTATAGAGAGSAAVTTSAAAGAGDQQQQQLPHPTLPHALTASHSTPAIVPSTSGLRRSATAASTFYKVAMWPEDEKRTTESAQVHGDLLRGYAKRFGPREGRSLVWSPLWVSADRASSSSTSSSSSSTSPHRAPTSPPPPTSPTTAIATTSTPTSTPEHDAHCDSDKSYWARWESQQAAFRARRKAESEVARLEEERVISELLDGAGMREEDQPQARRMRRMAYDGMPGPAELRGLTYSFDKFLYDLGEFTTTTTTAATTTTSTTSGEGEGQVEECLVQEKKRLFNFED